MSEFRVAAAGLLRRFPGGAGIHGVDLDVRAGEIHALVGLNGAGKTTLLRLLLGMLRPERGTVVIDGREIGGGGGGPVWAGVGHLVEHPFAYPELDPRSNLRLAARLRGVSPARIGELVARVLTELDLDRYARVRARRLSQGNRQRLGIAAALLHQPRLIVLDEPTNALDPAGVITVREALLARAADGAGVLVSSHHLDEVARVADRITVLNHGRIVGGLDPGGVDIERAFFAIVHADDQQAPA